MGAFGRFGRIALAAGSVALLSVEAVHLESPKGERAEEMKREAEKTSVEQKRQEEVKAAARRSKAPKMAPQFDGLNFYETFIGAARR